MPFIHIKTNKKLPLSRLIASNHTLILQLLQFQENSRLANGRSGRKLQSFFRNSNDPAAMVEVSLYGKASENALSVFTSNITGILLDVLSISTDRTYVSYALTEHWGWNGSNF